MHGGTFPLMVRLSYHERTRAPAVPRTSVLRSSYENLRTSGKECWGIRKNRGMAPGANPTRRVRGNDTLIASL